MSSPVLNAVSEKEIAACFDVMTILRPHLTNVGTATFVARVQKQLTEGYKLCFLEENGRAVSAMGFRRMNMLHGGYVLYIDDLVTDPAHRGKGHARTLLEHAEKVARKHGCDCVQLDSGPQRHDAHRVYLNFGFHISAHHFFKPLL